MVTELDVYGKTSCHLQIYADLWLISRRSGMASIFFSGILPAHKMLPVHLALGMLARVCEFWTSAHIVVHSLCRTNQ